MRGGVANEFKRRAVEMIRAGPRNAENAKRRFFYGPGVNNFDLALHKVTNITESKTLEFRFETFNAFNQAPIRVSSFHHFSASTLPMQCSAIFGPGVAGRILRKSCKRINEGSFEKSTGV